MGFLALGYRDVSLAIGVRGKLLSIKILLPLRNGAVEVPGGGHQILKLLLIYFLASIILVKRPCQLIIVI